MSIMEQNSAWPSKTEAARNAHEFSHKARQKEGGLWNFMTWAFFISQVVAGDQFIGAAAAAATDGDPQARKGDRPDDVTKNPGLGQLTSGSRTNAGEEPTAAAGQSHASDANAAPDGSDGLSNYADLPELNGFGRAPAEQSGAGAVQQAAFEESASKGPVSGGGSTPADNPSLPDGGGHGPLPDIDLGPIFNPGVLLPGIGDGVSDVIDGLVDNAVLPLTDTVADLVETLTGTIDGVLQPLTGVVDDLVGSVDGLLDSAVAPLTGALDTIVEGTVSPLLEGLGEVTAPLTGAIDDVAETLGSTIGAAAPALTGLVDGLTGGLSGQGEDNGGPLQDAVASAGEIVFKTLPVAGDLGLDSLFSEGGYTDYNLALRSDAADSAPSHGLASSGGSSTLLEHILTDSNDAGHQLDDDQGRTVGLPSVLDDIALRGLGDGISA